MAKKKKKKKRRGQLTDYVGPNTQRLYAIRDGIRGVRRALDRGACKDAAALLRLTEQAMTGFKLVDREREFLDVERDRLRRCKLRR